MNEQIIRDRKNYGGTGWNPFVFKSTTFFCHPVWWILYHLYVTTAKVTAKGPSILSVNINRKVLLEKFLLE